jgi:membrane protease YdiL (CAAX protease family)
MTQTIDPDSPTWGFGIAFLVWVFTLLLLIFVPLVFLLPYAARRGISLASPDYARLLAEFALKDPTAIFLQVLSTLPVHLVTFLVVWAVVTRFGKRPFWEMIGWSWGRYFGLWSSIGAGVVLFFASSGLAHVLGGDKPTQLDLILNSSPAAKYVIVFLATFTAPFAEEFIYRGLLYSALQRWIGKVGAVILVLGLFTLVHVPQYWPNYGVIAAVGLLSLTLTVVRAVSGRLLPCVVIHLVFNAIQSVLIVGGFTGPKPEITPEQVTSLVQPFIQLFHLLI